MDKISQFTRSPFGGIIGFAGAFKMMDGTEYLILCPTAQEVTKVASRLDDGFGPQLPIDEKFYREVLVTKK
jgi:hypothetical protein